ncbi:MAG: DUF4303 domain-containing protein [Flavobacteriales bacterium]
MDFKVLEDKIEKATKKAFTELYDQHKDEGIYSFSLYSDDGALTVCPAANTFQFLENLKKEEKNDLDYYKFEPAEWKYESKGAEEEFDEICDILYDELDKEIYSEENTFISFKNQLFDCCINKLKKLKENNFFKNITGNDIFLIFSVSDSDCEHIKRSVNALNDNHYKTEYFEWTDNEDN